MNNRNARIALRVLAIAYVLMVLLLLFALPGWVALRVRVAFGLPLLVLILGGVLVAVLLATLDYFRGKRDAES